MVHFGFKEALLFVSGLAWASGLGDARPVELRDLILNQAPTLRAEVLDRALAAFDRAVDEGHIHQPRLTVIDYELSSWQRRLWVIDIETATVLHQEWVAHGMGLPAGSGGDLERLVSVSNRLGTHKSSVGLFVTAETYIGRHGLSLRLDGLEPGFNDAARERAIVIHGADYVTAARAAEHRVGRSWGCPAVRPKIARSLIDDIANGSAVWIYYPEARWLSTSRFLEDDDDGATG